MTNFIEPINAQYFQVNEKIGIFSTKLHEQLRKSIDLKNQGESKELTLLQMSTFPLNQF